MRRSPFKDHDGRGGGDSFWPVVGRVHPHAWGRLPTNEIWDLPLLSWKLQHLWSSRATCARSLHPRQPAWWRRCWKWWRPLCCQWTRSRHRKPFFFSPWRDPDASVENEGQLLQREEILLFLWYLQNETSDINLYLCYLCHRTRCPALYSSAGVSPTGDEQLQWRNVNMYERLLHCITQEMADFQKQVIWRNFLFINISSITWISAQGLLMSIY